ncbi:MAG: septum formation protein Maf [Calditrichaeota bacterium]|nr:septum formation protein Maf [Calditrichota bacterium]MCB9366454.1 septum formation protein Maf [Calditrichota bacterium]MCB9391288.1 septum formation protein Maf [Calditrichota bacterium]
MDVRLTLVSASPRRQELLKSLKIPFDVAPSAASECWLAPTPEELASLNAARKVDRSQYRRDRDRLLLGADTIIALDREVFGKPAGNDSARRMLSRLSDRWHKVITGFCLMRGGEEERKICASVVAGVRIRSLSAVEIDAYLATSEWVGKAGAYAIQGKAGAFVEEISGDYSNVVGLPTERIGQELERNFREFRFL